MDPAQQNKYETEPWKQAKLKVMEYVDIIKTQLSTQLSKEQGDELILNLMDINENLGVSFYKLFKNFNKKIFIFKECDVAS